MLQAGGLKCLAACSLRLAASVLPWAKSGEADC